MDSDWWKNFAKKHEPVIHHDEELGELWLDGEGKWCGRKCFESLQYEVDFGIESGNIPPSLQHKETLRKIEKNCDSILSSVHQNFS